jgi:hypothetical protein
MVIVVLPGTFVFWGRIIAIAGSEYKQLVVGLALAKPRSVC